MSYWNYRVVKKEYKAGKVYPSGKLPAISDQTVCDIHSVHYTDDGTIYAYSAEPRAPHGDTPVELKEDLHMMLEAHDKPILTKKDFPFEVGDFD